ncbi:Alpha/Beta hydrolase protein [Phycomyces nitens]|nr:Alpha/Beta hydrolase protein [Phycomyces nitens]
MDSIRSMVKKSSPNKMVVTTVRKAMILPPLAARATLKELTKASRKQKRWIKKIKTPEFRGAYIGYRMKYNSQKEAEKIIKDADLVIFEIHGGGFRVGHCTMYMEPFIRWLKLLKKMHGLNAVIVSVEYGLAPIVTYPTPPLDCVRAYEHLVGTIGVPGSKIIMSGDSAGGALALETLMRVYAPKMMDNLDAPRTNFLIQKPAGLVLSSPLVTAETTSESWKKFNKTDIVSYQLADLVVKELLGEAVENPDKIPLLRLSHVQKGFDRFLPKNVLGLVGDIEVMRDDIVNITNSIRKDKSTNIELYSENYPHDWYFIREIVKKADKKMLYKYDEMFAEFSVRSIKYAAHHPDLPPVHPEPNVLSLDINSTVNSFGELIITSREDSVNETITPVKEKSDVYDRVASTPLTTTVGTY